MFRLGCGVKTDEEEDEFVSELKNYNGICRAPWLRPGPLKSEEDQFHPVPASQGRVKPLMDSMSSLLV